MNNNKRCSYNIGHNFGVFLKGSFPDRIKTTIMQGISATVIVIGLSMAKDAEYAGSYIEHGGRWYNRGTFEY